MKKRISHAEATASHAEAMANLEAQCAVAGVRLAPVAKRVVRTATGWHKVWGDGQAREEPVADEYGVRNLYHRHAQLCGQLTALQAERDALSVWCQAADDVAAEMKRERDALAAQLTAVEAERDRLRELVREELEAYYKWPNLGVTGRGRDWFTRARAALGEAKP